MSLWLLWWIQAHTSSAAAPGQWGWAQGASGCWGQARSVLGTADLNSWPLPLQWDHSHRAVVSGALWPLLLWWQRWDWGWLGRWPTVGVMDGRIWVPSTTVARSGGAVAVLVAEMGPWLRLQRLHALGEVGGSSVREFSKQALSVSFSFWNIPPIQACHSKQVLASHTTQLSNQTRDFLSQGSSWPNSSQPASTVSVVHTVSVCLPLHPYSLQWLQASRSLLVLLKPCLAVEGAVDLALSQEPWGCSCPGSLSSPKDLVVPEALSLPSDISMCSTVLASSPHICWDTIGCSLCCSEDRLGVLPLCRGKWTPLPPISLPSPTHWVQFLLDSLGLLDFLEVYFLCQKGKVFLHYLFK